MLVSSRNIVIEAGAGTGKTTRLVEAILEALVHKGLPLTSLVALTFTKKAAGEMKERIAQELRKLLADPNRADIARTALEQIDRASISTIHSFAFSLLKRFPLAAGIDPGAEVDEKGFRFDELFAKEWPRFLARELGSHAPHEAAWLEILQRLSLSEIETLARRLCDFDVPLDALPLSDADLAERLKPLLDQVQTLGRGVGPGPRKDDKATRIFQATEEVLGIGAAGDWDKLAALSQETRDLLTASAAATKAWSEDDIEALRGLQQVAANVLRRGDRTMALLTERLKPFAAHVRAQALAQGILSHSALLFLSRELLRKRHDIRLLLKREIRMLFIDEFQDTDPLQGELLLFLAEKPEGRARTWREVEIEDGKLFVVGDPKQSIYRFRGADIAAYRQITDLIQAQGGTQDALQTNYRSHDQIVHAVNAAFETIIEEIEHISPAYTKLEPHRKKEHPHQEVELRLVQSAEKLTSEQAQEAEAEDIANWISKTIPSPLEGEGRDGGAPPASVLPLKGGGKLRYKDIALIFRSSPPMTFFVEALRRRDIPFVVEGERYFYSTPEVTDFLSLLRVVENPNDQIALVGYLRSPLGGMTDQEILRLKQNGLLNISGPGPDFALLRELHNRLQQEPLRLALDHIFDRTFILELAAGSYHRDQTLANLFKLRRLLETFAEEGATTLGALLDKMKSFMENDRLEGESPLADENYDAVRLLTIHKAKGLEFPVVFLPGLHTGRRTGTTDEVMVDWSTGRVGLRAGKGYQNLDKLILDAENRRREAEEEKRILYVAMTRPKERLVLSGGLNLKQGLRSDSYLKRLLTAWRLPIEGIKEGTVKVGETDIRITFIDPTAQAEPEAPARAQEQFLGTLNPTTFASTWVTRAVCREKILGAPVTINPSKLIPSPLAGEGVDGGAQKLPPTSVLPHKEGGSRSASLTREQSQLLGTLLHRFLEDWDFKQEKCHMPLQLRHTANAYFSGLGILEVPFPDPKVGNPKEGSGPLLPQSLGLTPMLTSIVEEAQSILADFIGSDAYNKIAESEVLGREVPFIYKQSIPAPLEGEGPDGGALVRGTMDIVYRRKDGQVVIGDYKSDQAAGDYSEQGKLYQEAVKRSLGQDAEFKIMKLR